jgi:hypothetical protein
MKKSRKGKNSRIIKVNYLVSQFWIKVDYMKSIFRQVTQLAIKVVGGRVIGEFKVAI